MKKVGSYIVDWWRLVVPYFKSEERWIAISLLIGAVGLTLGAVALEVLFNDWNRRFYDSLQNKDEAAFWREIKLPRTSRRCGPAPRPTSANRTRLCRRRRRARCRARG